MGGHSRRWDANASAQSGRAVWVLEGGRSDDGQRDAAGKSEGPGAAEGDSRIVLTALARSNPGLEGPRRPDRPTSQRNGVEVTEQEVSPPELGNSRGSWL